MLQFIILPVTPFQQNCTLFWCDETMEAAVVDPGGNIDIILAKVSELKLNLTKIWLTHGHLDHVGGTNELLKIKDLLVEGPHKEDKFWLDILPQQTQQFGFGNCGVITPNRWLEQGDVVTIGHVNFDVYFCPGHTPGHVIFHNKEAKLVQVGDVLFKGSIGRTDFPKGNHEQLIHSIKTTLFPLGDDVQFISGHGPMSTLGHERNTNPYVRDN